MFSAKTKLRDVSCQAGTTSAISVGRNGDLFVANQTQRSIGTLCSSPSWPCFLKKNLPQWDQLACWRSCVVTFGNVLIWLLRTSPSRNWWQWSYPRSTGCWTAILFGRWGSRVTVCKTNRKCKEYLNIWYLSLDELLYGGGGDCPEIIVCSKN